MLLHPHFEAAILLLLKWKSSLFFLLQKCSSFVTLYAQNVWNPQPPLILIDIMRKIAFDLIIHIPSRSERAEKRRKNNAIIANRTNTYLKRLSPSIDTMCIDFISCAHSFLYTLRIYWEWRLNSCLTLEKRSTQLHIVVVRFLPLISTRINLCLQHW